jgi:hypothetical protein
MERVRLLDEFEKAEDRRKFILENIDSILELLYSLKFKIDKLYEATQVVYDKRNRIVRAYVPVREFLMVGYIPKSKEDVSEKAETLISLLKELIEIKEDCKELREQPVSCNAFLKAFHRFF